MIEHINKNKVKEALVFSKKTVGIFIITIKLFNVFSVCVVEEVGGNMWVSVYLFL